MFPALECGDVELAKAAARLLVVRDHGFGAANVAGQDHGLSLLNLIDE
jgi:hypothetical protein